MIRDIYDNSNNNVIIEKKTHPDVLYERQRNVHSRGIQSYARLPQARHVHAVHIARPKMGFEGDVSDFVSVVYCERVAVS